MKRVELKFQNFKIQNDCLNKEKERFLILYILPIWWISVVNICSLEPYRLFFLELWCYYPLVAISIININTENDERGWRNCESVVRLCSCKWRRPNNKQWKRARSVKNAKSIFRCFGVFSTHTHRWRAQKCMLVWELWSKVQREHSQRNFEESFT